MQKKYWQVYIKQLYYNQRLQNANAKEAINVFRNLDAEQARKGYTNSDVAELLGISRVSYENKKKSGKFTTMEVKELLKTFNVDFEYLFFTS